MSLSQCYPDKAPKVNRLCEILSDDLRREIIHFFENYHTEDTARLETVAEHIADRVPGTDLEEITVELRHRHLPKLDEYGWIDFDPREDGIRYRGHDRAARLLDDLRDVFTVE